MLAKSSQHTRDAVQTSRGKVPVVFISSVFKTLGDVRPVVRSIVCDEFGWNVWSPPRLNADTDPGYTKRVCFRGLEQSDIYLGIYPNRYGSDPLGLAFTELEYHHAVRLGMPRLLYGLHDNRFTSQDVKVKQNAFLSLIQDRDISPIGLARAQTSKFLYRQIRSDLRLLQNRWRLHSSVALDPFNPISRLIDKPFNGPPPYTESVEDFLKTTTPAVLLRLMDNASNESYSSALEIGTGLLHLLLNDSHPWNPESLWVLHALMKRWHKYGSWAGITSGLTPLRAAKAQIALTQLLGDHANLYQAAAAVASCYYSEGNFKEALHWCYISRRNNSDMSIQAAAFSAQHRPDRAKRAYVLKLNASEREGSETSFGHNLAQLGLIECRQGVLREGLAKLWEGSRLVKRSYGFRARVLRALATGLTLSGEIDEAREQLHEVIVSATIHGLGGQRHKAAQMLAAISSRLP